MLLLCHLSFIQFCKYIFLWCLSHNNCDIRLEINILCSGVLLTRVRERLGRNRYQMYSKNQDAPQIVMANRRYAPKKREKTESEKESPSKLETAVTRTQKKVTFLYYRKVLRVGAKSTLILSKKVWNSKGCFLSMFFLPIKTLSAAQYKGYCVEI